MWKSNIFKAVGNKIGEFLEAGMSFIASRTRRVARTLVKLDPREGLIENLNFLTKGLLIFNNWTMKKFHLGATGVTITRTWQETSHCALEGKEGKIWAC